MIHAKMTKPRKAAVSTTIKTVTKTAPKTTAATAPKTTKRLFLGVTTGRSSVAQPRLAVNTPALPPVGTVIEILIDDLWWPGKVDGHLRAVGLFHVDMFAGAPSSFAIVDPVVGGSWRIANRLHSIPLTRQGVRNLDMAAPPRFRNGRRFRKPKHFEAICSHPEEALAEEPIEEEVEGLDENRQLFTYTLQFLECGDCGAEISI